jgi:type II pantothenate kinase
MLDSRNSTAGIDLGGCLTKIAHGHDPFQLATLPASDLDAVIAYLKAHNLSHLVLTGGGSVKQRAAFAEFHVATTGEFDASARGANYLLDHQGGAVFPYMLVSIGTGTSISKVDRSGVQRVTGTGVGGGTLLGLGSVLTGEDTYDKIISKAASGDRSGVDTLVRDIYDGDLPGLGGDVTAANFGKAASRLPEDLGRAALQMVGEVIAVIASLAAKNVSAQEVLYVGGALRDNPVLVDVLKSITQFMDQRSRFVQHGEYVGAIGALLQGQS